MPSSHATRTASPATQRLSGWTGEAKLYHLSEPLAGHQWVIVSATVAFSSGPETYIFGATPEGDVFNWGELPGSYRGGLDHAEALRGAGYEVTA